MDEDAFVKAAEAAKENCPVSVALRAVEITLDASLAGLAAGEDGVLVRVGGRAATQQDERLVPGLSSLCTAPGAITTQSPARTARLVVAEPHRPRART